MFYKFIDENTISKAPKPLKIGGKDVFTNSEQIHNENGYYKVEHTEYPQDEKYYESKYVFEDNTIRQVWVEVEQEVMSEQNETETE